MARAALNDGLNKFSRYRLNQQRKGMKLLRMWTFNPHDPGFQKEAKRQSALLRNAPEENQALEFIEQVADWGTT